MGGWVRCLQDEKNRNTLGKKGTFVVHVQYLENSTWQGEIGWAEKNESLKFRSALELLKIMDSALATTEQGEEKGEKL
ncbi:hypothetical protein KE540_08490 [Lachnospiraceae bacterium Marseille-Q4251]|nr:hypothetical protein [Lachnospiraceae bacterium Marseille-Q4251]